MKKLLSVLGWIVTILLQGVIGYLAGVVGLGIGRGAMPVSIIFMWLAITLGLFLVGALALLLRRAMRPKRYLARLGVAALGVMIPLAIMVAVGLSQGFDSEALSGGLGLLLPLLATILGLVGFYVPGWVGSRSPS